MRNAKVRVDLRSGYQEAAPTEKKQGRVGGHRKDNIVAQRLHPQLWMGASKLGASSRRSVVIYVIGAGHWLMLLSDYYDPNKWS